MFLGFAFQGVPGLAPDSQAAYVKQDPLFQKFQKSQGGFPWAFLPEAPPLFHMVEWGLSPLVTTFMVQPVTTTEGLELLILGYNVDEEGNQMIWTKPKFIDEKTAAQRG